MLQMFVAFSVLCCKGLSYFSKAAFLVSECLSARGGFRVAKIFGAAGAAKLFGRGKRKKKAPRILERGACEI